MAVATPLDRDQFDAALFNWLRTKMDVHGCKSLDELIALVALGERFDFRPLSKLPLFDRIGVAMVGLKKITCNKCDRQWNEPLQERIVTNAYGHVMRVPTEISVQWCSQCSPAERQPKEGETFKPHRAKGRGGFLLQGWRDRLDRGNRDRVHFSGDTLDVTGPTSMDERLTRDALQSAAHQEETAHNRETIERERITTPDWIRERAAPEKVANIAELLTTASRAKISRLTGLSDSQVRAANNDELWDLLRKAAKAP